MSNADDKVSAEQFSVRTTLTPREIRAVASRAAEAGKRTLGGSISQIGGGDDSILFAVKGPGGFVELMRFLVSWHGTAESREVHLKVGAYTTVRQRVMFIPVAPESAPALPSLQRFSMWMKRELEAA